MAKRKPAPEAPEADVLTTQQLAEMVGADAVDWVEQPPQPSYIPHGSAPQVMDMAAALDALLVDMEAIPEQMQQAGLHGVVAEMVDAYVQQKSVILATSAWFKQNAPLLKALRERMG